MTTDDIRMNFSKNLRTFMESKKKTQSDLVRDLDLRQATVSDWINGKKYPRMDKMELLANYFGITISDLVEGQALKDSTRTEPVSDFALSESEKILIKKYRRLTPEDKYTVDKLIDFSLTKSEEDEAKKEEQKYG